MHLIVTQQMIQGLGAREQETLEVITSVPPQVGILTLRFNTFRNDLHIESLGHCNDAAAHRSLSQINLNMFHETLIDLDFANR